MGGGEGINQSRASPSPPPDGTAIRWHRHPIGTISEEANKRSWHKSSAENGLSPRTLAYNTGSFLLPLFLHVYKIRVFFSECNEVAPLLPRRTHAARARGRACLILSFARAGGRLCFTSCTRSSLWHQGSRHLPLSASCSSFSSDAAKAVSTTDSSRSARALCTTKSPLRPAPRRKKK